MKGQIKVSTLFEAKTLFCNNGEIKMKSVLV